MHLTISHYTSVKEHSVAYELENMVYHHLSTHIKYFWVNIQISCGPTWCILGPSFSPLQNNVVLLLLTFIFFYPLHTVSCYLLSLQITMSSGNIKFKGGIHAVDLDRVEPQKTHSALFSKRHWRIFIFLIRDRILTENQLRRSAKCRQTVYGRRENHHGVPAWMAAHSTGWESQGHNNQAARMSLSQSDRWNVNVENNDPEHAYHDLK